MKKTLTIACLLLGSTSFAQLKAFPKKASPGISFLNRVKPVYADNALLSSSTTINNYTSTDKVYSLPLDKMPCLVPDTRLITPIPNRGASGFEHSLMIPNPFKKENIIPAQ